MSEADHYNLYREWLIPLIFTSLITPALIYLMALPWKDQIFPDLNARDTSLLAQIQANHVEEHADNVAGLEPATDPIPTPSRLFTQGDSVVFCRPLSAPANRTLSDLPIHVVVVGGKPLVCHAK